jgi:Transposase DDE domain
MKGARVGTRGRRLDPRPSEKRGTATGPSPVDRARNGSKHHLLVDATGIPPAWTVTGGNRNDVTQLIPLVERIPPVRGTVGRPRERPGGVVADRGYDHDKCRCELRRRGIGAEIARRKTQHGSALAASVGSSSAPSPGYTTSSDCSSATTAATRSTKPSSRSMLPRLLQDPSELNVIRVLSQNTAARSARASRPDRTD